MVFGRRGVSLANERKIKNRRKKKKK